LEPRRGRRAHQWGEMTRTRMTPARSRMRARVRPRTLRREDEGEAGHGRRGRGHAHRSRRWVRGWPETGERCQWQGRVRRIETGTRLRWWVRPQTRKRRWVASTAGLGDWSGVVAALSEILGRKKKEHSYIYGIAL
jgi:hypothetical protein